MKLSVVRNGSSLIVNLTGRIDSNNAPQFESELREALDGVSVLVLDMGSLDYISSAGLRTLLEAQKLMEAAGGSMTLLQVPDNIREILDMTGFTEFLTIL